MTPGSVARRYAKALYELAAEEGSVEQIATALAEIATAVAGIDANSLAPGVLDAASRRALGEALAGPVGPDSTLGKFLRLIVERDRVTELPGVQFWFVKRLDEEAGRVRATVTAANELTDSQTESIVAVFRPIAGRDVLPEVSSDPDLLGGAIVELEGRVYDGSVKTRLARLAARMAGAG